MKIIVAGGRDFNNFKLLTKTLDSFVEEYLKDKEIVVVSGGAKGADSLGEAWYHERLANSFWKLYASSWDLKVFPANWEKHGKAAGPIRNAEMAEFADMLIAFWDGKSSGTKNMIQTALKKGLLVKVVTYGDKT